MSNMNHKSLSDLRVGVLALQGDVSEHLEMMGRVGARSLPVKTQEGLEGLDGLIIPGGESTTVGKLLVRYGLDEAIRRRVREGMALYGTCTGLILLAQRIHGSAQPRLGLMDMDVERNAFGRQVDSFEVDIPIPAIGGAPFRAVFIRAPFIREVGSEVEVLARLPGPGGQIVMARQGKLLASAFHPELTDDPRVHAYFLRMILGQ